LRTREALEGSVFLSWSSRGCLTTLVFSPRAIISLPVIVSLSIEKFVLFAGLLEAKDVAAGGPLPFPATALSVICYNTSEHVTQRSPALL
jgi:hypothetical protein